MSRPWWKVDIAFSSHPGRGGAQGRGRDRGMQTCAAGSAPASGGRRRLLHLDVRGLDDLGPGLLLLSVVGAEFFRCAYLQREAELADALLHLRRVEDADDGGGELVEQGFRRVHRSEE